jgi:hypothetical protein
MALTFVNLQDKVLGWLDEGTAGNADADQLALVKEALNESNVERATEQRWPFMASTEKTLTLVKGQREYTLDATFHIPIFFWNDSTNTPLTQYDGERVPSRDYDGGLIDDYFTSNPLYGSFVLQNQTLVLTWTPTATDSIRYKFYKLPTEMSVDGDVPDIPYPHSRLLIYDALMRLSVHEDDLPAAKVREWEKRQEKHETALREAHGQLNNQWSEPGRVSYTSRD